MKYTFVLSLLSATLAMAAPPKGLIPIDKNGARRGGRLHSRVLHIIWGEYFITYPYLFAVDGSINRASLTLTFLF